MTPSIVTPEDAMLVYDPWVSNAIAHQTQVFMGGIGFVMFMLVVVILMLIWIMNAREKNESRDTN
jgi:TRAP-type mannitol/chloroaromatic compound transport system permease large subunit